MAFRLAGSRVPPFPCPIRSHDSTEAHKTTTDSGSRGAPDKKQTSAADGTPSSPLRIRRPTVRGRALRESDTRTTPATGSGIEGGGGVGGGPPAGRPGRGLEWGHMSWAILDSPVASPYDSTGSDEAFYDLGGGNSRSGQYESGAGSTHATAPQAVKRPLKERIRSQWKALKVGSWLSNVASTISTNVSQAFPREAERGPPLNTRQGRSREGHVNQRDDAKRQPEQSDGEDDWTII